MHASSRSHTPARPVIRPPRELRVFLPFILCICLSPLTATAAEPAWQNLKVPGAWETTADSALKDYDGYAWYRCQVKVPSSWKNRRAELLVSQVGHVHEAYVNGVRIGAAGSFPPKFSDGSGENPRHAVPADAIKYGGTNDIAIRIYNKSGNGGFLGQAPVLLAGKNAIALNGQWEFRTGDDPQWAKQPAALTTTAIFWRNMTTAEALKIAQLEGGLSPAEAVIAFTVPDDLVIETVLAEPQIAQPVFMTFDTRGRMWVVEYRQYPYPNGLKLVSKDKFWRAVYDRVPEPPPHGPKGADRISIHEDTNGDGTFDKHSIFLDDLNIASSCAVDHDGVWVLNPPYLLFYPDKNHDDKPDGPPVVHLEGFGMEDTHSVVNSLRFGPDGWLYAAQGSTVSGNVRKPGEKTATYSMGQLIWRYHPRRKKYEIFAEGGGNAFGVEIDKYGQIFSGHNGGNTRGFHYVQGGYYRKGFGKHGPLSNPYTFGYFEAMKHAPVPRFTHNFIIYEAEHLPQEYQGKLFGIEPLQGRVVMSEITPRGSTYETKDLGFPVTTTDRQFRPVDIKLGPDGAIYIADFYEPQISHSEHFSGQIEKDTGRIYRLRAKSHRSTLKNLAIVPTMQLLEMIADQDRSTRHLVVQELVQRDDKFIRTALISLLNQSFGESAPEALWGLYQRGEFDDEVARRVLSHHLPTVRAWGIRLLCDDGELSEEFAAALEKLAGKEEAVQVRSQMACSARRLPAGKSLPIIARLLTHDDDVDDPHQALLLWWAIEAHADADRDALLAWLANPSLWTRALLRARIVSRLMQCYAAAGTRKDLLTCAALLKLAPDTESRKLLLTGFEAGVAGRSLGELPIELVEQLTKAGGGSLSLQLRQGKPDAVATALKQIADVKTKTATRVELTLIFGQLKQAECVPVLLKLLEVKSPAELQQATLATLRNYADDRIGQAVSTGYTNYPEDVQAVAASLLASRAGWAKLWLTAVADGRIVKEDIPAEAVRQMTVHTDAEVAALIKEHWPNFGNSNIAQMEREIARHRETLAGAAGNPTIGKQLYTQSCGKCHLLFDEGGRIGPSLTAFNRDDTPRMLKNIVNPSAEIREGFESYLVLTVDGRVFSGFLFDEDKHNIVLRGVDGQNVTIAREDIEEQQKQAKSLMPEGLLTELTPTQLRDLFAYLRSAQPLN